MPNIHIIDSLPNRQPIMSEVPTRPQNPTNPKANSNRVGSLRRTAESLRSIFYQQLTDPAAPESASSWTVRHRQDRPAVAIFSSYFDDTFVGMHIPPKPSLSPSDWLNDLSADDHASPSARKISALTNSLKQNAEDQICQLTTHLIPICLR